MWVIDGSSASFDWIVGLHRRQVGAVDLQVLGVRRNPTSHPRSGPPAPPSPAPGSRTAPCRPPSCVIFCPIVCPANVSSEPKYIFAPASLYWSMPWLKATTGIPPSTAFFDHRDHRVRAGQRDRDTETLLSIAFCTSVACSGPFSLFEYCNVIPCAFAASCAPARILSQNVSPACSWVIIWKVRLLPEVSPHQQEHCHPDWPRTALAAARRQRGRGRRHNGEHAKRSPRTVDLHRSFLSPGSRPGGGLRCPAGSADLTDGVSPPSPTGRQAESSSAAAREAAFCYRLPAVMQHSGEGEASRQRLGRSIRPRAPLPASRATGLASRAPRARGTRA